MLPAIEVNGSINLRPEADGELFHQPHLRGNSTGGLPELLPKVFVFSTGDESGIGRLIDIWEDYLAKRPAIDNAEEVEYLEGLSDNLARRRSALSWRSFIIGDSVDRLRQIRDLASRPVRAEEGQKLAFIFSGQGTAYCQMGLPLLVYPTFRHSLESFDIELTQLGCQWSLLGMSHKSLH